MLFNGFSLRTFELQFLLLARTSCNTHVIAGLNVFDRWVLYDDLKLLYGDFNPKCADFKEDFCILFAGYVNITQDKDRDGMFIYYFTLCVQKVHTFLHFVYFYYFNILSLQSLFNIVKQFLTF